MIKIDLPRPPDTGMQSKVVLFQHFLELHPDRMARTVEFECDEPEKDREGEPDYGRAWVRRHRFQQTVFWKRNIIGLDLSLRDAGTEEHSYIWQLDITVDGRYEDITLHFRGRTAAEAVWRKLFDWWQDHRAIPGSVQS